MVRWQFIKNKALWGEVEVMLDCGGNEKKTTEKTEIERKRMEGSLGIDCERQGGKRRTKDENKEMEHTDWEEVRGAEGMTGSGSPRGEQSTCTVEKEG